MIAMAHHDPTGPFGYAPDGERWDSEAAEALQRAHNFANAAARNIADWEVARLPMDAFRLAHYRRAVAAERYARAVYQEATGQRSW
jgi:hypothetical protein